jgi:hypothetical protein
MEGKQDCEKRPLVPEVNADKKYEDYFNKFFIDGGEYKNYISLKDERLGIRIIGDRKATREGVTFSVVVRVKRSELKQKLITDGILN